MDMSGRAVKPWQIQSKTTHIEDDNDDFFCLGTQPSQFINVLNSGILLPYQHVKHKINLTLRPGITFTFLKFLHVVDTNSWRHLL